MYQNLLFVILLFAGLCAKIRKCPRIAKTIKIYRKLKPQGRYILHLSYTQYSTTRLLRGGKFKFFSRIASKGDSETTRFMAKNFDLKVFFAPWIFIFFYPQNLRFSIARKVSDFFFRLISRKKST